MANRVKLAVLGAGLIGKRHVKHVMKEPAAELMAVVDPSPVGQAIASEAGVRWFPSFADMTMSERPDGVIIATPNQVHVQNGLEAVAAGVPALVEKPIADDIAAGEKLVQMAEAKGVALLTGHHRRHNPMMQKAKEIIDSGTLGRILIVNAMFWLFKPDEYFDIPWRRERGAGPVFLNLIHDIDNLRFLCGDISAVQARESNAVRRNAVEETAVILIEFKNGVLGTASVADSVVAPWSWEMTTGENPAYPKTEETCYMIGGTHGSLAVPSLEIWSNAEKRSWTEAFERDRAPFENEDPLVMQIRQFCSVIRGEEAPLVSGREGLETLKVIEAVKRSAATGGRVVL
ncbi:gfo/Idh/MocA family oxidoreductase [Rhizobium vallis]|uniref:Gfo/Idh/MocA family oxidoreductase n=1 Tax=Rhizobium vallis TaxID=634290 RepID=A0A3S0SPL3_9HYPH|nr:Gfo/Idh/MocA family oxidoreductase [Rhizobium vallis]RUM24191.1 gfo/Idh/MocA family oxidoreductase [Rhizobium vallis]